jgi:aspartyl-tRNA(Asn)/glutamyl-tRNA(Gln) amidotransferase subunit A
MMGVISGHDARDSTSKVEKVPDYRKTQKKDFRIAIVKESIGEGVEKGVRDNLLSKLGKMKYDIISLPLNFRYSIQTYYLLSMAEVSTNLAMLCGMRYGVQEELSGNFNEYFSKVRSSNFEKEAKRRIILGTYARMSGFRDAFYLKALKVRTRIIDEYKEMFRRYDLIITPSMPNIAPRLSDISKMTPLENYMADIMTAGPNLTGLPHLSLCSGYSQDMPTGMLLTADHFNETDLIDFARLLK